MRHGSEHVAPRFQRHASHMDFNFPPKEGSGIARLIPHVRLFFSDSTIDDSERVSCTWSKIAVREGGMRSPPRYKEDICEDTEPWLSTGYCANKLWQALCPESCLELTCDVSAASFMASAFCRIESVQLIDFLPSQHVHLRSDVHPCSFSCNESRCLIDI